MGQVPYAAPDTPDDAVVTYGVKELLSDIRDGLNRVDVKLDSKADRADVQSLEQRVGTVERDVVAFKNRALGMSAACGLAVAAAGALAAYLT